VTIAAGEIMGLGLSTTVTIQAKSSQRLGATIEDMTANLPLAGRQPMALVGTD
jgi:hypothetical protein